MRRSFWRAARRRPCAAGHRSKAITVSTDGGAHWELVAKDGYLDGGPQPVPNEDGGLLAASRAGLWLLTQYFLYFSSDGGRSWHRARSGARGNGPVENASFYFLNGRLGWLFEQRQGLWRTEDGEHLALMSG